MTRFRTLNRYDAPLPIKERPSRLNEVLYGKKSHPYDGEGTPIKTTKTLDGKSDNVRHSSLPGLLYRLSLGADIWMAHPLELVGQSSCVRNGFCI